MNQSRKETVALQGELQGVGCVWRGGAGGGGVERVWAYGGGVEGWRGGGVGQWRGGGGAERVRTWLRGGGVEGWRGGTRQARAGCLCRGAACARSEHVGPAVRSWLVGPLVCVCYLPPALAPAPAPTPPPPLPALPLTSPGEKRTSLFHRSERYESSVEKLCWVLPPPALHGGAAGAGAGAAARVARGAAGAGAGAGAAGGRVAVGTPDSGYGSLSGTANGGGGNGGAPGSAAGGGRPGCPCLLISFGGDGLMRVWLIGATGGSAHVCVFAYVCVCGGEGVVNTSPN